MLTTIPFIVLGIFIIISGLFIVKQQTSVIVERFGKFSSIRHAGLQYGLHYYSSFRLHPS
jgi:regulator of protease activity HflC (stomatin/prohibitin superfamily)